LFCDAALEEVLADEKVLVLMLEAEGEVGLGSLMDA
jgi:hypothetical protein